MADSNARHDNEYMRPRYLLEAILRTTLSVGYHQTKCPSINAIHSRNATARTIGYPYGLWITPDQHVWMVDGGFDRIVELDQAGRILGSIGSPGHQPGQLAWGTFSR